MYRLLIADDEALEREGLEFIIERMLPGQFQIIHAENGRLAIHRAEQHRPHIVMMDIKMPGIEGLEALRQMKEKQPDLKMVLLTAYDYFSYAQQAVSLGVKEYLLKPAKRDQVVSVLQRLVDELEAEGARRDEELQREEKLSQLQPLVASELAILLMADAMLETDIEHVASLLELELGTGAALAFAAEGDVDRRRLANAVRRLSDARGRCIVSPVIGRHVAVFALEREADGEPGPGGGSGGSGARRGTAAEQPEELARRFAVQLAEQLGVPVRAAAGPRGVGAAGLRASYRAAARELGGIAALALGAADGPGGDADAAAGAGGEPAAGVHALGSIERAKAWLAERYREELSMEDAAEHVGLSPFYFSKLFKQHVGETFIDYVTRLRIDRAKELIAGDADLSLKEVCFEVGYNDPNYFSRVFKKVTGMSPTEYRSFVHRQ
jgi:two-component system response regulator YesN